ncbi:GNAT family N-acetyltransferase [Emergencia timonensis]|uniref:GNAT family N-acetyltransferase n=1 Tax=Emergencia timonensis TaxID=1776384 RepID=UPI003995F09F
MKEVILRKAAVLDMDSIMKLQISIFEGEQKIPAEIILIAEEMHPQWWCALLQETVVGAVAAWEEKGTIHWGRFVMDPDYRGLHIGTRLAKFSLDDLFSQGIEEIHLEAREATVKIICSMGGKIMGQTTNFYEGTVTPLVLYKQDYAS